ncbi:hypothetical protein BVRB_8g181140 [Beta vulgaris subsp. vulgaris]|nr:hypothetical protein BVRB_8g181140 [Beta vulgaris subsp. vulgaris]
MAPLPTELIAEILSNLPVKQLLQFLIVSKSWYNLIKSPNFIKLHLNQTLISDSHRHLILSYSSLSSSELHDRHFRFSEINHPLKTHHHENERCRFREPFESSGIRLLGSCNGVVCISDIGKNDVVLFNPSTRTYRKLPSSGDPDSNKFAVFGFGYDCSSDDYKVLKLIQCCGPNNEVYNDAKVYSLRLNSWKRVNDFPYYLIYPDFHGAFVANSLHYIVSDVAYESRKKSIARFDLRTESYSILDCPEYDDDIRSWTFYLGNLGGCLCCAVNYDFHGRADLWVMKEYGNKDSWIPAIQINKEESSLIDFRPVGCSADKERILVEVDNCELHWYDMRSETALRAGVDGLPKENYDLEIFVESLVMLGDDKVQPERGSPTRNHMKKKKTDLDDFLAVGFKLRL